MGNCGADRRQIEPLRDGCDDGYGAISRDGQDAVDGMLACDPLDGIDVGEVDHLSGVGERKTWRVGVPIHGDDPETPLARLGDRPALVPPGADEEDARHAAMLDGE
jgi:hypothetical protein